jgi:hypothetical protein
MNATPGAAPVSAADCVAVLEAWLKERREEATLFGSSALSLARDEALDAAIRALRQEGEPVAFVQRGTKRAHVVWIGRHEERVPDGARLYLAPPTPSPKGPTTP